MLAARTSSLSEPSASWNRRNSTAGNSRKCSSTCDPSGILTRRVCNVALTNSESGSAIGYGFHVGVTEPERCRVSVPRTISLVAMSMLTSET